MLYDYNSGLSYLEILASQLTAPRVTVHEFGHSLTLASQTWVDQTRTGAWWETVANWVADTYVNSGHGWPGRGHGSPDVIQSPP